MEKQTKKKNTIPKIDWHEYSMPNPEDTLVDVTIHTKTGKTFYMTDNIDFPEQSLLEWIHRDDKSFITFLTGFVYESIIIPNDNIDYIHISPPRKSGEKSYFERMNKGTTK